MQDLGSVGYFNNSAFAINDAGVVVGETDSEFGPSHAGLWTAADGMEDLGVIGMSVAFDINNRLARRAAIAPRARTVLWDCRPGLQPGSACRRARPPSHCESARRSF